MDTLGALLTRLVGHRSVVVVAAQARIWPGTLSRWMAGLSVPDSAAPLEAVGIACGANEWQLNALVDAWWMQTHPPIELRHAGFVYLDARRDASGPTPGDLYNAALHAVWVRTGQLKPVAGQDAVKAGKALREWQLDRLLTDDELRESIRRALKPEKAGLTADPEVLERRVAAETVMSPSSANNLIGAALLHPDAGMRARARELLTVTPPPPLPAAEREAVLAAEAGPDPSWGQATAPADRAVVEHGIRECYRLVGRTAPETIVWVDSPYTGVLLRRLATPLYDVVLWNRYDRTRDIGVIEFRYEDDLRLRMDRDIDHLIGHRSPRHGTWGPLALLDEELWPARFTTDPQRARQSLEEAAARLPEPRPELGPGDPPPAKKFADRYHHLGGQGVATWIGRTTRLVAALQATGTPLGDLPERLAAYRDANTAGPWWPGTRVVIVSERPVSIEEGRVLRWADGTVFGS